MPVVTTESATQLSLGVPMALPNARYTSFDLTAGHIVGMAASPFTGSQQLYEWPGAYWKLRATLPPMLRAEAADWQALMIALRGLANTFVAGDPLATTPRGTVLGVAGVTLPGTSLLSSKTLPTWGWTTSQANILRKMDYFQIPRNYLQNPSAIDQAGWEDQDSASTVTGDNVNAPDGTATADRIVFPGAASRRVQNFYNAPGVVGGQAFTFTLWLRAGSSLEAQIGIRDLISGSPDDYEATTQTVALTTTWQRFTVTRTVRAAADAVFAEITNLNDNAAKTIYGWGTCVYSLLQDAHLYAVLADAASDSDQNATLDIFPPLRLAGADIEACPIITTSPVGTFRLTSNEFGWMEDTNKHWRDMSFEAVEAL